MFSFVVFQQKLQGRSKQYCRVLCKLEDDIEITSDIYVYTVNSEVDCCWSDLIGLVESTYEQCVGQPGLYNVSLDNLLELIEAYLDDTSEWTVEVMNPPREELDQTIRAVCPHGFN